MTDDAQCLLARLDQRYGALTRERNELAREATVIRECMTRLRTGQAVAIVEAYLLDGAVRV